MAHHESDQFALEDDLLDIRMAYENVYYPTISSSVRDIECDDTGKFMAVVHCDGTVAIWNYLQDQWVKQANWKIKGPALQSSRTLKPRHDTLVTKFRTSVIARWCHGHGRYLAVASNASRKAHIVGENTDSPPFNRSDPILLWNRKHSITSAGPITEMRFSPSHVEFTLVTATVTGMIVVHMLQNKNNIKTWRPIHAISIFRDHPINSLSWNQNPIHELPILIASTNSIEVPPGKQIAVFAINSPSVRSETNMCFENTKNVCSVSFAPSRGLNDSLLAVAAGRRVTLYLMTVEEFQVPEEVSPSNASDSDEYQTNEEKETGAGSSNAVSSSIEIDKVSERPAGSMSVHSNVNSLKESVVSSDSPLLPRDFFQPEDSVQETLMLLSRRKKKAAEDTDSNDDGSTEEEELEKEASDDKQKALMWHVECVAVFREPSAIRKMQWGKNSDSFTVQLVDGTIQSYKWTFGCVWSKSTRMERRKLHLAVSKYPERRVRDEY